MKTQEHIKDRFSKSWELDKIHLSHNIVDYQSEGKIIAKDEADLVRLHFGMQGSYDFEYKQLNSSFSLAGQHNNIMYSQGLEIEVKNKSERIETFGINFSRQAFIEIGQNGNDPLKRFTDKVINQENSILSPRWKTSNFKIQEVIQEIIHCNYENELKDLFLLSKSIELLVLQAALYEEVKTPVFIKSEKDKKKLIEAKELLQSRLENPPTIVELAKLVALNEYKLKRGFKELFGVTVFGYIHQRRMNLAKKLLLGTDKSAKDIAYETGYSSPQHFSKAFKKQFGITPKSIRTNPDHTINNSDKSSHLKK